APAAEIAAPERVEPTLDVPPIQQPPRQPPAPTIEAPPPEVMAGGRPPQPTQSVPAAPEAPTAAPRPPAAPAGEILEDGIRIVPGKGPLGAGKFLARLEDGSSVPGGPWNTPEEAFAAARAWRQEKAAEAVRAGELRARK